jgi:glutamyl/glutaminyl-tRNA synthetase
LEYRDQGYLPEAIRNFLLLLGWSYDGEREFFTLDEMVEEFEVRRIGTSAAIFDKSRLDWFNGIYIRRMTPEQLTDAALPFLLAGLPEEARNGAASDRDYLTRVLLLDQERIKTLKDVPELVSFFFVDQPEYDASLLLSKNLDAARSADILKQLIPVLAELGTWEHEALLTALDDFVTSHGFIREKADGTRVPDRGPVFMLVRVGVSGRRETPGLPEMLATLGKDRVLKRLEAARHKLEAL